jgi:hypothetical protein
VVARGGRRGRHGRLPGRPVGDRRLHEELDVRPLSGLVDDGDLDPLVGRAQGMLDTEPAIGVHALLDVVHGEGADALPRGDLSGDRDPVDGRLHAHLGYPTR